MNRPMRWVAIVFLVAVVACFWNFRRPLAPVPAPVASVPVGRAITEQGVLPTVPIPKTKAIATKDAQAKVALLQEILASRNDNDPRLDREFRQLDIPTKQALADFYRSLPLDDANGRGTIVFLLGREITRAEDLPFFEQVLAEKIRKLPPSGEGTLPMELLAAYPQVMAVSALRSSHEKSEDSGLKLQLRKQLEFAAKNPNKEISRRARVALRPVR